MNAISHVIAGVTGAVSMTIAGYGFIHNKDVQIDAQRAQIAKYEAREERLISASNHVAAAADELQKALVFDMEAPKPPEGH